MRRLAVNATRARGFGVVLASMACLLLPASPAAAGPPRDFAGIVSEDVLAGDSAYRDSQLESQRRAGIGLIRQTFRWADIERAPGQYDLSIYDGYVGQLAHHGMRVLPILFGPPDFRSSVPGTHPRDGTFPPGNFEDLGTFAAVLVKRYGTAGSFWRENPSIPYVPITSWQVWNEPNLEYYWASGPSPAAYTQLLRVTADAIRSADPWAQVVTAGIPNTNKGMNYEKFIAGMYRAGARTTFDTLAINPYGRDDREIVRQIARIRKLMDRNHQHSARIWVTELGWATAGPRGKFTVDKRRQAKLVARSVRVLAQKRRKLGLRGIVYFNWRDLPAYNNRSDFWGLHTGLLDRAGRPKPGLAAFRSAVRAARK